jgi:zinc resistance-associated protein
MEDNMKKIISVTVLVSAVGLATGLYAMGGMGGMNCNGPMGANVKPETAKEFFKETSDLRTDMMVKRIELRQEMAKETPDQAKIDALRREMGDLRAKMQDSGKKYGMAMNCDDCGMGGGMGRGMGGNCDKQGRGMGKRMVQPASF